MPLTNQLETDRIDIQRVALAMLSGLLLSGAFPKVGMAWLAWLALIPLLWALEGRSAGNAFRLGFIAGLTHYLALLYWIADTLKTFGNLPLYLSVVILMLFCSYLALFFGFFAAAQRVLCRRPTQMLIVVPATWVSLEYIRSFFLSGFPWEFLGHSQYQSLHLIQIADVLGVYGISFMVALGNVVLFGLLRAFGRPNAASGEFPRSLAGGAAVICLLIGSLAWYYGIQRLKAVDARIAAAPRTRISLIQGNIPQSQKWAPAFQAASTTKYVTLSLAAQSDHPDLVVWPETATPFFFLHDRELSDLVQAGIRQAGTAFLIGSPSFTATGDTTAYYNSAYLLDPRGQVRGKYDKVHLVPFGEYVPLKKFLPFIDKLVQGVGDFRPGQKGQTLSWKDYRIGIQICYEIIFPSLSRVMAENGANLLVNLTNDAWYGRSSAPYQHFSLAIFRAVENRRALVRAANTGISGFIDPGGRIRATTPLFENATLTQSVPLLEEKTFYTRFGDVFALACLLGMGLMTGLAQGMRKVKHYLNPATGGNPNDHRT